MATVEAPEEGYCAPSSSLASIFVIVPKRIDVLTDATSRYGFQILNRLVQIGFVNQSGTDLPSLSSKCLCGSI